MGDKHETRSPTPLHAAISIAAGIATAGLALGVGAVFAARTMKRAMSA